jgi:hypothetical protein
MRHDLQGQALPAEAQGKRVGVARGTSKRRVDRARRPRVV